MDRDALCLGLRTRVLIQDANGRNCWETRITRKTIPADQVAIIVCDVWDDHWSRGAAERVDAMVQRFDEVIRAARTRGVQIIHAPSDCMDFYSEVPARRRMMAAPKVDLPELLPHVDPPLPAEASDGGSDTGETMADRHRAWTRQHPEIEIRDEDGISDDAQEIFSFLQAKGIYSVLIMGVHTNCCILNRPWAIKSMIRRRVDIALVRDLTDSMYDPAMPPYVSHDEGTRLTVEYIEQFWCPSITSDDITGEC